MGPSVWWEQGQVKLIDQTQLPGNLEIVTCKSYVDVARAIKTMQVRGAPAIGIAAAMGVALGAREYVNQAPRDFQEHLQEVIKVLKNTRPTAVNLFWALEAMKNTMAPLAGEPPKRVAEELEKAALQLAQEDLETNYRIGRNGSKVIPERARILTHCNAGGLATVGYGTALGVIRAAHEGGKLERVFADETRPLLQGARLTAWELQQENIPVTLITDNMAGHVMSRGMVDLVLVGADRIACNGDVANKIGTYSLAVLASENQIPFFVAAPLSTFDFSLTTGDKIPIEERAPEEVTHLGGIPVAPEGIDVYNPAFDITPNRYITGIITEAGVINPPFKDRIAALAGGLGNSHRGGEKSG